MPQASKTFRIFVSSTFSDLKAERNALQEHVFPRLRELAERNGCRFQAIDLRWGIRDEVALDQQTVKICLEEIARCQRTTPRPNFIILLGDRYGWRPLPAEIPAAEFEAIIEQISRPAPVRSDGLWIHQNRSDADRALLERWYKRDDNAVPPVYCLQRREGEYEAGQKWEAVEERLRGILVDAIGKIALLEREKLKYLASATEQEIVNGALSVHDAREYVFCFFRRINYFDSLVPQGMLTPQGRLEREFYDASESYRQSDEARANLLDLKERLRQLLGKNVYEYRTDCIDLRPSTTYIGKLPATLDECLKLASDTRRSPTLCEDVWRSLSRVILDEIARLKEMDPLETEAAEHEGFGAERAKHFVGRTDFLDKITRYLAGTRPEPLVIFGASGSGKSAFTARAADEARRRFPNALVIARFIGATPASSDGQALLDGVCHEITRRLNPTAIREPAGYESLIQELPKVLSLATSAKPIIVFLDALDQLSSTYNARNLKWLPADLPVNARFVVSTTPGDCLSALENKISSQSLVELQPMAVEEGGRLLDLWLKDAARTLQPKQREHILDRFSKNGLPLYLKLAFEESRRWSSFRGRVRLERDVPGILGDLFRRLEEHHGKMLVSHGLGYLATARNGLTEDEILDLLALDREFYADFEAHAHHDLPGLDGARKLPVALWSRLYFDLEPYLTERSADGLSLLSFYHRQVNEAVVKNYLDGAVKRERHRTLAQFFGAQEIKTTKNGQKLANVRKVSELPFHQTHGELWRDLEQTLCDLDFVEAKCEAGQTYDLAVDYDAALSHKGFKRDQHLGIEEFARFVRSQSRVLAAQPKLVFQQAANEPDKSRPAREAIRKWESGERVQPWLRALGKSESEEYFLMRLQGHTARVTGCAFSPDGRKILSASEDGTLRFWDGATGEELLTMRQQDYYDRPVWALEQGGTRIISANLHGQVRVWDSHSGAELSSINAKWGNVMACGFAESQETFITSAMPLGWFLKVRNGRTGKKRFSLRGFWRKVRVCVMSNRGDCIASASDKTLNLWNTTTGKRLFAFGGFKAPIIDCGFACDGTRVFAINENEARLWDMSTGEELPIVARAPQIALSRDGKRLVAFNHSEIALRTTTSGRRLATFAVQGQVTACAFSPDGKRLVSASSDGALTLWEAVSRPRSETAKSSGVSRKQYVNEDLLTYRARIHTTPARDPRFWDELTGGRHRSEDLRLEDVHWYRPNYTLSPDETRVVTSTENGSVLWDSYLKRKLTALDDKGGLRDCCFSPDGSQLVTASDNKMLKLWSASGSELATLRGHKWGADACVFSLDGTRILSTAADGTRIWDSRSGTEIGVLEQRLLALSPDGQTLLVSNYEYTTEQEILEIIDLQSGRSLRKFADHPSRVEEAAFSPDGELIVSAAEVKLWNARTGQLVVEYPSGGEHVQWAPDGKQLMAAHGIFQLENLSPGPVIVTAWVAPSNQRCAFGCASCRRWVEVAIADLDSEAQCVYCSQNLRLNSFVIRAEWEPVAKAWRGVEVQPTAAKRKRSRRVTH